MECLKPMYLPKQDIYVPCGKCPFCTATRRADWILRLNTEARLWLDKRFVTLTYANPHLRWRHGQSQLCKDDLQRWFKAIRRAGYRIRYYAVGEYGSTTYRPHYHVILFGSVPEELLRSSWRERADRGGHILGHVHIGTVTQASIAYTLGYIVNSKGPFMLSNRVRPFSLMSRKPGLGHSYLTPEMIAWHRADRRNYAIQDGIKRHLPRYYKGKIFSKIDQVRIAVYTANASFKRDVEWLRHPLRAVMKDPLAYRALQRQALAVRITEKSKELLTI